MVGTADKQAAKDLDRADVLFAPLQDHSVDLVLDRGCFHYLAAGRRPAYSAEAARVLRPRRPLLLRACLSSAGQRNDIDAAALQVAFTGWGLDRLTEAHVPSDTRQMPSLLCRLISPDER
jgi:hypothetical protein